MIQIDGDTLPHARDRVEGWLSAWKEHGGIVVLLDFDGTLAPIAERPEAAAIPESTRDAVQRLIDRPGAYVAIVSGRGLADARDRARLQGIAYAGNHGMEIHGAGVDRIHPEAAAARPRLQKVMHRIADALSSVPGAIVEDKDLTLSIHYRLVVRALVDRVRKVVTEMVAEEEGLRVTEGKEVLEVRPDVDWDKGRAVDFLLKSLGPKTGTPILYVGDDRTDEDAFEALRGWGGDGVIVGPPPPQGTAATAFVETTEEVAQMLDLLVRGASV